MRRQLSQILLKSTSLMENQDLHHYNILKKIVSQLKDFLRNHRNIKVRMILICEMERQIIEKNERGIKNKF